jgi:hypothetical protein
VTGPAAPTPPAWVRKRDGRLVPFEADKISRSLFAAGEDLGRPDPFLARELTDGVLHFLCGEVEGSIPTTAQVAELVAKVVRELGQPALARAYAEFPRRVTAGPSRRPEVVLRFAPGEPPASVLAGCLRSYTRQAVFTRDLVAAHDDGLLTLTGLEAPLELAGTVVEAPPPVALLEALLEARQVTADVVALDGVEHTLAQSGRGAEAAAEGFAHELAAGLRATGLRGVVNLNAAVPPAWAGDLAEGPLFAGLRPAPAPGRLAALADAVLEALRHGPSAGPLRIDWHLGENDLAPPAQERLRRLARHAAEDGRLAFVFDRPRKPLALAEGIDRRHAALLLTVGLHLPRLAEQPGANTDPGLFVQKLGSLARLGLSAAVQKREFLRGHGAGRPALYRGFLLERARLAVAAVGLEAAARALTGRGLGEGKAPDLARQAVQRLRDVVRQDGRACLLDACLDAPADFVLGGRDALSAGGLPPPAQVAGLTGWDAAVPVKAQLRAAGVLHGLAEGGTAALLLPEGMPDPEQVADWLRWAWRQTEVVRVRLVRPSRPARQLPLPSVEAGPV